MKFTSMFLAATLALASGAAFAGSCPKQMRAIDAALAKNPQLSAQKMADVKKYRAEGERLHKAKQHKQSVETLGKAQKILGI